MRLSFSARNALRCYTNLLHVTCSLETARKQEQNNRINFRDFTVGFVQVMDVFRFLFIALYVVCSTETSDKTVCFIRCRNSKHTIIGTNRNNFAETYKNGVTCCFYMYYLPLSVQ